MPAIRKLPEALAALVAAILLATTLAGDGLAAETRTRFDQSARLPAADALVRLPMLKRPIKREELISESDIVWVDTSARRLPRTALTDIDDLVGKAARRYLAPGRAVLARDVAEPLTIKKGDLVSVVYTTPFLTLTARGRALEDAPTGDAVRVLNAHSNRTVEAMAVAPGLVATRPISHKQLAEALK